MVRKEKKRKKKKKRKVTGDVVIGFSPARAGARGGGTFPIFFPSQRHSSARLVVP
jgi:hypothetical protein